jgi:hypothetical protein
LDSTEVSSGQQWPVRVSLFDWEERRWARESLRVYCAHRRCFQPWDCTMEKYDRVLACKIVCREKEAARGRRLPVPEVPKQVVQHLLGPVQTPAGDWLRVNCGAWVSRREHTADGWDARHGASSCPACPPGAIDWRQVDRTSSLLMAAAPWPYYGTSLSMMCQTHSLCQILGLSGFIEWFVRFRRALTRCHILTS